MNIPFARFFKKEKAEEGSVAVAPPPVTSTEKPVSERLGKTVLPNSSRIVGLAPVGDLSTPPPPISSPIKSASASTRKISLGGGGSVAVAPKVPAGEPVERTITLPMSDLVAGIPSELLKTPVDTEQPIVLKAAEVERGMGTGRPTVLLRAVYKQAPESFADEVPATDLREVPLPFAKVVEQFARFQVRDDQIVDQGGPQFETPFLQVTLEDNKRFEKSPTSPVPKGIAATQTEKVGGAKPPAVVAKTPTEHATPAPTSSAPIRIPPASDAPVSLPKDKLPATAASAPIRIPPASDAPASPPKDKLPATTASAPAVAATPTPKAPIRFSPPPVTPVPETSDKTPASPNQTPAVAAAAPAAPAPPKPSIPIKLSAPSPAGAPPSAPTEKASSPLDQSPASPPTAAKLSPNGTGVPAAERVPASSGSPVPTPLPSPTPSSQPTRIPFKVGPPSNDLRPESKFPAAKTNPDAPDFSNSGPRISLPLRNILRNVAPFQLSGPIDDVPETAQIEIPFSIVQPQLSLGRVAISPAQFQAALPEEYRKLFKVDQSGTPVPLLLQDVLQNLPSESLQLRGDQEELEVAPSFETPFSVKATEDAARMKVSAVPIAKTAVSEANPTPEATIAETPPKPVQARTEPTIAETPPKPVQARTEPIVKVEVTTPLEIPPRPIAKAPVEPARETPKPVPAAKVDKPVAKAPTADGPARRTALQNLFDTDEPLDAKTVLAHISRLPGVSSSAIVFSDGLSLAGNIPAEYEADGLCATAPSIMKRIGEQMAGGKFGELRAVTLFCTKTQVSLFADGNICLATLHSDGAIAAEVRDRLGRAAQELARMYAQPNA
jgi:predicted regulator of Ras-like GTPase activity (Roadblock/LC7/MglB family)